MPDSTTASLKPKKIAVIVAAGSGSRFGADRPKQFCDLAGRPVLMTTIEAFSQSGLVDDILVVLSADMVDYWDELCSLHGFTSPQIVTGGKTRARSVKNAIDSLSSLPDNTVIMIHDGARPFPSKTLIETASNLPDNIDISLPAVKMTDSLREIDDQGNSKSVDRSRYYAVQTPQSSRLGDLAKAYSSPLIDTFTDDASALEASEMNRVLLIPGSHDNIKITNPGDLDIASIIYRRLNGSSHSTR